MTQWKDTLINVWEISRSNLKIIFGGRFVYFILSAFLFFVLFGTIMALDNDVIRMQNVYGLLAFPALLMVFYPSTFGIQSDADQRTLEIIFGIPNYRYKIWLVRLILVEAIVFVLLFPFAGIAYFTLISFPIFEMVLQLMVLVVFVSMLSFALSTIVRNGNATAVIVVILGLVFLILSEELNESKWNVFLNPFREGNMNEILWAEVVRHNRMFMGAFSLVLLLMGLLNLQRREKFL